MKTTHKAWLSGAAKTALLIGITSVLGACEPTKTVEKMTNKSNVEQAEPHVPKNPADGLNVAKALTYWTKTVGETASISIDHDAKQDVIAPEIYGHFAEHLGRSIYEGIWVGTDSTIPNTNGYRNDVVEALKGLHIPVLRWPGGCFADEYDWRDGIGPRHKRPTRINTHWGWVEEDNSFGTHEFLNFAEMIGADAYVAGNMGSGTPREMAQWVEYMTSDMDTELVRERKANGRKKPWKVRYFGVGNESWGCGGNMTAKYSADLHARYATFIKQSPETKPEDRVLKVATGANVDDYPFTEELSKRARPWSTDALSIHYYTFAGKWEDKGDATGFPKAEWASTMYHALFMQELITKHSAIMDKYDPEKRIGLYVDEWGTWFNSEEGSTPGFLYQQNSVRDALVAALSLNIFHRHTDRVKMGNIAQMVNVLQASILTKGDQMILTPTYHILNLYVPFQGATPLPLTINSPSADLAAPAFAGQSLPHVDASLARTTDGDLVLSLVNLDAENSIDVDVPLTGVVSGHVITGAKIDSHNTFDAPSTVSPKNYTGASQHGEGLRFTLPPRSVVVVRIK